MQRRSPVRSAYLVMRRGHEITDEFVTRLIKICGKDRSRSDGLPGDDDAVFKHWKEWSERRGVPWDLHFYFLLPSHPNAVRGWNVQVSNYPRAPPRGQLSNSREFEIPLFSRQPDRWSKVSIYGRHFDHADSFDAQWCLTKFMPALSVFEPEFAYGDIDANVVKHTGDDPRKKVWPILVYGGEMVKDVGRERLIEAPVFRVDELAYGGICLQVAENPFTAKKTEFRKLADYLNPYLPT